MSAIRALFAIQALLGDASYLAMGTVNSAVPLHDKRSHSMIYKGKQRTHGN